ncbi:MAG: ABC transporter substrate-binding protein, partial [Acidimicrobiia bacterium]
DVTDIAIIRVGNASAAALIGFLEDLYEGEATFPVDVPVPAGTTDFSQFIAAAEAEDVGGVNLAVGEQEGVQVIEAGQQLGTDLLIGTSLGSSSHASVADLGDFASQMVFTWSFPPATYDLPVYEALRADLAASGEESLQLENLKGSPMRSWIGLYGLLRMIRDAEMTEFTREGITAMLDEATGVPMLGIFGDEDWTPALDHPGAYTRAGINHWVTWKWDPDAEAPNGLEGNFVETGEINFDELMCGSSLGAPEPC